VTLISEHARFAARVQIFVSRIDHMTLAQIEAEIEQIAGQMKPLIARTEALNRERRRLKSVAFIEANSVRIEDVEMSSGDGKP